MRDCNKRLMDDKIHSLTKAANMRMIRPKDHKETMSLQQM
jgi:hypothetical protein